MDRRDERISQMDLVATAVAGSVVLGAVVVLAMTDLAHNRYDSPYAALGGLGGVTRWHHPFGPWVHQVKWWICASNGSDLDEETSSPPASHYVFIRSELSGGAPFPKT